jgi:hypothetical protein
MSKDLVEEIYGALNPSTVPATPAPLLDTPVAPAAKPSDALVQMGGFLNVAPSSPLRGLQAGWNRLTFPKKS